MHLLAGEHSFNVHHLLIADIKVLRKMIIWTSLLLPFFPINGTMLTLRHLWWFCPPSEIEQLKIKYTKYFIIWLTADKGSGVRSEETELSSNNHVLKPPPMWKYHEVGLLGGGCYRLPFKSCSLLLWTQYIFNPHVTTVSCKIKWSRSVCWCHFKNILPLSRYYSSRWGTVVSGCV